MEEVIAYDDSFNEEGSKGIVQADNGYRYREIDGLVLPPYVTPTRLHQSLSIQLRADDIVFCSYPKSGSTWLSNILLLLTRREIEPGSNLRKEMIWMESSWPYPNSLQEIEAMPQPRIFKSHMPMHLTLGGGPAKQPAKFIYIYRNPKDVCTSYYHFERDKNWSGKFQCPWDEWFEMFMSGRVQRGDWFSHIRSWTETQLANVLTLSYEDLSFQFNQEVTRIAAFLDVPLSHDLLTQIKHDTSFEKMKSNPFSSMRQVGQLDTFYRKGTIGSWQDTFTEAQSREVDDRVCGELRHLDLSLEYS